MELSNPWTSEKGGDFINTVTLRAIVIHQTGNKWREKTTACGLEQETPVAGQSFHPVALNKACVEAHTLEEWGPS